MSTTPRNLAVVVTVALSGAVAPIEAKDLHGIPAKIEVTETSVAQGTVKIGLVDPANLPAPAKKDLRIEIQTKSESGRVGKSSVTIKQGQAEATAKLPITSAGIVEVAASNPELAQGGTVVNMPGGASTQTSATATPGSRTPAPEATVAPVASATPREPNAETSPQIKSKSYSLESERMSESRDATNSSNRGSPPTLKLRYYPARKLRADQKDPATVCATLPSDWPAPTDFSVFLMSDLGPLTPEPIKIPAGRVRGEAKLVATQPGTVQVWYEYSDPPATSSAEPLKIEFTHPVWQPKLVPTSKTVGLFDSDEVAVELANSEGTSVPADEARPVDISIDTGSGQLTETEVRFAANDNRRVTTFIPTWPGNVKLIATSPYLPTADTELNVTMPYGLLILCGFGSVLGALLVYLTDKESATWKRIVVGFITGYVLYWALLFGVVFIPNFPHVLVINPLSAVILPLFGGWAGIKVMTLITNKFGWNF